MDRPPLYQASIYYAIKDDPQYEKSATILFECEDGFKGAKQAAWRWWRNRHKSLPDVFHLLFAIKVYAFETHPVDEDGRLPNSIGMRSVEWKCDHCPIDMWLNRVN